MSKLLKKMSVQTQINAAMFVVALLIVGGLIGALSVSGAVTTTFSELTERRMPKAFAALTTREVIADIRRSADRVRVARSQTELKAAEGAFAKKLKALDELIKSIEPDNAKIAKHLSAVRSAMAAVSKAVAANHAAGSDLRENWRRSVALHSELRKKLAEIADDTAFSMEIAAGETRSTLTSGIDKLVSKDLPMMVGLMAIKVELGEIGAKINALETSSDAANAAANADRLASAVGRLKALLKEHGAQLDKAQRTQLETLSKAVATAVEKLGGGSGFARAAYLRSKAFEGLKQQRAKSEKAIVALVDDASFNIAINGGELSTSSAAEIDKIVKAASGDYKVSLEAVAAINSAIGWLGQITEAGTRDELNLVLQNAASNRQKIASFEKEALIKKAGLSEKLTALVALLADDGAIAAARRAQFDADAKTEASGAAALDELKALADMVGVIAADQRRSSDAAVSAAMEAVAGGRQLQIIIGGVSVLALVMIVFFFIRPRIVKPLRNMRVAVERLAQGVPTDVPGAERGDEIGGLAKSMSSIYDGAVAAQRVETALSSSNVMVLIACEDGRIQYVNARLQALFNEHANAFKAAWPDFAPEDPTSSAVSALAATPEMTEALANGETYETSVQVAGRLFQVATSPVVSDDGAKHGVVVEWRDQTEAVSMQQEIDRVVSDAAQGHFAARVEVSDQESDLGKIGTKINELLQSVSFGLDDVTQVLRAMAARDLTRKMSVEHSGAFAELSQNVNATVDSLRDLLSEMVSTSASLDKSSRVMRSSADDISRRAESQAASLEETAASMEEMAKTTKSSAENAGEATEMTQAAAELAGQGDDAVRETVDAITRTETSAEKITEIVGVMESIAFQTNLLALNAAVESARAGEAGKGFAVVASEVRALAQRSSDASRDVQELVSQSVVAVRDSVTKVREAGEMIAEINRGVVGVNAHSEQIAKASQEQAISADEIRSALRNLDEMTQQNALSAEQAAAQAAELSNFADKLAQLAGSFALEGGDDAQSAA